MERSPAGTQRAESGERLRSGEPFTLPRYITVRGTVSAVEIRQHPVDANTNIPVAEINLRESPVAAGRPYPEFNVCTDRLDILQDVFGADFRTGMIGRTMRAACIDQSSKATAANPRNQDAINRENSACMGRIVPDAQKEGEKAEGCARGVRC